MQPQWRYKDKQINISNPWFKIFKNNSLSILLSLCIKQFCTTNIVWGPLQHASIKDISRCLWSSSMVRRTSMRKLFWIIAMCWGRTFLIARTMRSQPSRRLPLLTISGVISSSLSESTSTRATIRRFLGFLNVYRYVLCLWFQCWWLCLCGPFCPNNVSDICRLFSSHVHIQNKAFCSQHQAVRAKTNMTHFWFQC